VKNLENAEPPELHYQITARVVNPVIYVGFFVTIVDLLIRKKAKLPLFM
jgi:hypothetical protein